MRRGPLAVALLAVLSLAGCSPAGAPDGAVAASGSPTAEVGPVRVFAAASLTEVFERIARSFEGAHPGVKVEISFGGSAGLAAQILEGAPADVFAAASEESMAVVDDAGLLERTPVVFARNTLEIAVPPGNPAGIGGLADLARPELAIALCDAAVPCGAAAARAFAVGGLTAAPDTLEQDVRAVLTKVRLGEVDAGLVYRTDVLAAGDEVEGVPFPEADRAVTDYPIAVLSGATPAARAFVEWVGRSGDVLAEAGFVAR